MVRILETALRRLNRYRASSNERRLAAEVAGLNRKLDETRAECDRLVESADRRAHAAEAKSDSDKLERKLMQEAVERMRAHYRADTAEAAKRIAGAEP